MGRVIASLVENRQDCEITAGIDLRSTGAEAFPVFSSLSEVDREADVLIDFSNPSLLSSLLQYAREKKLPVVLCTTGYTPEQVQAVKDAAKEIPVFYSRNMSLGINLLIELAKRPPLCWAGILTLRLWKNTITRSWTLPAAQR